MRHWDTKRSPSSESAALEGGADRPAWEKMIAAGVPRRVTRITESPLSQSYVQTQRGTQGLRKTFVV